jgi:hypothetical protein
MSITIRQTGLTLLLAVMVAAISAGHASGSRITLLTGCIDEYYSGEAWSNDRAVGLTYDDQLRVSQKMTKLWDWDNGSWLNESRLNVYYNQDGNISQTITEFWSNDAWYLDSRRTLFWSNGLVDSVLAVYISGEETYPLASYYCSYNSQTGRIASVLTDEHTDPGTRFQRRQDYAYDQQGRPVTVGSYYDTGEEWVLQDKTTTIYQPQDQSGYGDFWLALLDEFAGGVNNILPRGTDVMLLQDKYMYVDEFGEMQEYSRQEYFYSEELRLEQMLSYSGWVGTMYLDFQQDLTYDAAGLLQQYVNSYYYGGPPVASYRSTFSYQEYADNDDPEIMPPRISISSGPNPFTDELRIKFRSDKRIPAKLEVYNIRGQKVRTLWEGILADGAEELLWTGTGEAGSKLSAGVYLLRLSAGESVRTSRVMLLREARRQ